MSASLERTVKGYVMFHCSTFKGIHMCTASCAKKPRRHTIVYRATNRPTCLIDLKASEASLQSRCNCAKFTNTGTVIKSHSAIVSNELNKRRKTQHNTADNDHKFPIEEVTTVVKCRTNETPPSHPSV